MFGKRRRQTHLQDDAKLEARAQSTPPLAPMGQPIVAPVALTADVAPSGPVLSSTNAPAAAPLGPFAMQTRNTVTARTRTTKDVIALVCAQRPAWTNRLPDVTPSEVATLHARSLASAATASPPASAPGSITQPATVPSTTKGGSSWAFIDHR